MYYGRGDWRAEFHGRCRKSRDGAPMRSAHRERGQVVRYGFGLGIR